MNFYKRFIGDYGRDTGDLTLCEHGAFTLMLDTFYATEKPLPKERKVLYRLLRAESEMERKAIDTIAARFWKPLPDDVTTLYGWLGFYTEDDYRALGLVAYDWGEPGGLINVRALAEIVKAAIRAEKNRRIAQEREANKRAQAQQGVGHGTH